MRHGDRATVAAHEETLAEWAAKIDAEGQALCREADWWKELKKGPYRDGMAHRTQAPSHYVFGKASPMYIEQFFAKARDHAVFAVYFGQQASNTRDVVQGGAICSVFDLLCAAAGTAIEGKTCVTRSVNVEMLKPIPIRSLVKAEARLNRVDGRKVIIDATMSDGNSNVFATASVVHIAMSKNKERSKI